MFDIKLLIGLDAVSLGDVADAASVGSDQQKPSTLSAQRQTRIFIGRNLSLSTVARPSTGKFGDQRTRCPLTSIFLASHVGSFKWNRIWTREKDALVCQTKHEKAVLAESELNLANVRL